MKYIVILLSILLSSCVTRNACNKKFPPQVIYKDSIVFKDTFKIVYKETFRDTTILTKADSDAIKLTVICDKNGNASIVEVSNKNGKIEHSINIKNNVLTSKCKCDTLAIKLKLKDTYESSNKISSSVETKDKTKIVTVEKEVKPFWWSIKVLLIGIVIGIIINRWLIPLMKIV